MNIKTRLNRFKRKGLSSRPYPGLSRKQLLALLDLLSATNYVKGALSLRKESGDLLDSSGLESAIQDFKKAFGLDGADPAHLKDYLNWSSEGKRWPKT